MLVPFYIQMSWYCARAEVTKFCFSFYLSSDENIHGRGKMIGINWNIFVTMRSVVFCAVILSD